MRTAQPSQEQRGKKGLKRVGEGGQFTETGYRRGLNKPENKKRPDRRLEQIDSLRVNRLRLIQSEAKRNQFESVWRGVWAMIKELNQTKFRKH